MSQSLVIFLMCTCVLQYIYIYTGVYTSTGGVILWPVPDASHWCDTPRLLAPCAGARVAARRDLGIRSKTQLCKYKRMRNAKLVLSNYNKQGALYQNIGIPQELQLKANVRERAKQKESKERERVRCASCKIYTSGFDMQIKIKHGLHHSDHHQGRQTKRCLAYPDKYLPIPPPLSLSIYTVYTPQYILVLQYIQYAYICLFYLRCLTQCSFMCCCHSHLYILTLLNKQSSTCCHKEEIRAQSSNIVTNRR